MSQKTWLHVRRIILFYKTVLEKGTEFEFLVPLDLLWKQIAVEMWNRLENFRDTNIWTN